MHSDSGLRGGLLRAGTRRQALNFKHRCTRAVIKSVNDPMLEGQDSESLAS